MKSQDGVVSILISSQQEAVVCVCHVFRKKVCFVTGSSLSAVKIKNVRVRAMGKFQVLPKLGKSTTELFLMIKQVYSEEALGCSAMFKKHKCFARGRDSLEDDEHTNQRRMVGELKIQEITTLICVNHSQMAIKSLQQQQQQQRIAMVPATKF
jgi:hypothetical protein